MSLFFRKKQIVVAREVTYGTDAVSGAAMGAAQAILTQNLAIKPLTGNVVERPIDRAYLGNVPGAMAEIYVEISFDVDAAGCGTAGIAHPATSLFRACRMTEVLTATTSAVYSPTSASVPDSCSIYFYLDGILHKLLGARGDWKLMFDAQDYPNFTFTMQGLFSPATAQTFPTFDTSAFQTPLLVSTATTTAAVVHGQSMILKSAEFDLANQLERRFLVGNEQIAITERKPAGKLSLELPPIGTYNYYTDVKNASVGTLRITHGTVAGNIVQVDCPVVQLRNPAISNDQGVAMLGLDLALIPSAGDDELVITFK